MDEKVCIICGKLEKARGLCLTHHQRMLRTGAPYLKGEQRPVPLEEVLKRWNLSLEKKKVSLRRLFG